jgi:hypothetical protein
VSGHHADEHAHLAEGVVLDGDRAAGLFQARL